MGVRLWIFALLTCSFIANGKEQGEQTPFLRVEGSIFHPRLNPQNTRIAFTEKNGSNLSIVDLQDGATFRVTGHRVDYSYFWAPDGARLFYRESFLDENKVRTRIMAYDTFLRKSVPVGEFDGFTSTLEMDPRDHRFYILSKTGIRSFRIDYPTERIRSWKESLKTKLGYWVVTAHRILWITNRGISLKAVNPEGESIQSHMVSHDGRSVVWSTTDEKIYYSKEGESSQMIAQGVDPIWHPDDQYILFAKSNRLGKKVVDHDLAIANLQGSVKNLTRTRNADERFPQWASKSGTILYTFYKGTDLFEMSLNL